MWLYRQSALNLRCKAERARARDSLNATCSQPQGILDLSWPSARFPLCEFVFARAPSSSIGYKKLKHSRNAPTHFLKFVHSETLVNRPLSILWILQSWSRRRHSILGGGVRHRSGTRSGHGCSPSPSNPPAGELRRNATPCEDG